jgi:hypothetical protein
VRTSVCAFVHVHRAPAREETADEASIIFVRIHDRERRVDILGTDVTRSLAHEQPADDVSMCFGWQDFREHLVGRTFEFAVFVVVRFQGGHVVVLVTVCRLGAIAAVAAGVIARALAVGASAVGTRCGPCVLGRRPFA